MLLNVAIAIVMIVMTTVRNAGANVFPVKKATDLGLIAGLRIYPSGPYIGQT